MIIINTIDDRTFSFNGIPYLRNYISAVYSNGIEIFNCYERNDVLASKTPHNQYRVNGIVYNTPASLQTALLDVIYSRNTMGGEIPDQDNLDIRKYFHYTSSYTSAQILDEINGLQSYTINEKQSVWFIGRTFELLPVIQPGGVIGSTRTSAPPPSLIKYKMMNKGKGAYGQGGIQLTMNDLELIYQNAPTENDIAGDPETDVIEFGELGSTDIHTWLNLHNQLVIIQPQNEGYTLFKGTVESQTKSFLWVGASGTYGLNGTQSLPADFQVLEYIAPIPYIPGQNEVTAMGNVIIGNEHRFIKVIDGIEIQAHAINEDGEYFKKNNFVVVEKYADPIADVQYIKPAKAANDTYAMMSDLKLQQLKIIDTSVINSLYTIANEDFGKTLVYNGLDDIDMLLSTNTDYQPGCFVNIIQANVGNIAFVADGFILKHSPDELPETYSFNSTAGIIILDEYEALVFGKLKIAN